MDDWSFLPHLYFFYEFVFASSHRVEVGVAWSCLCSAGNTKASTEDCKLVVTCKIEMQLK